MGENTIIFKDLKTHSGVIECRSGAHRCPADDSGYCSRRTPVNRNQKEYLFWQEFKDDAYCRVTAGHADRLVSGGSHELR